MSKNILKDTLKSILQAIILMIGALIIVSPTIFWIDSDLTLGLIGLFLTIIIFFPISKAIVKLCVFVENLNSK